jgi:hypothetical protein
VCRGVRGHLDRQGLGPQVQQVGGARPVLHEGKTHRPGGAALGHDRPPIDARSGVLARPYRRELQHRRGQRLGIGAGGEVGQHQGARGPLAARAIVAAQEVHLGAVIGDLPIGGVGDHGGGRGLPHLGDLDDLQGLGGARTRHAGERQQLTAGADADAPGRLGAEIAQPGHPGQRTGGLIVHHPRQQIDLAHAGPVERADGILVHHRAVQAVDDVGARLGHAEHAPVAGERARRGPAGAPGVDGPFVRLAHPGGRVRVEDEGVPLEPMGKGM